MKSFKSNFTAIIFLLLLIVTSGCGKSELELQKEKLRKDAAELKVKIDSTQQKVNTSVKELDSLKYKTDQELKTIDSLKKVIESLDK
jgi:peptidoglycan hydrolase CwlO-like protein